MSARSLLTGIIAMLALAITSPVRGDDAPIAGSLKSIDAVNRTVTVESAAQGNVRTVVIDVKPETKIIRFVRGAADGKGFAEQSAKLEDLKLGWMVSVNTHHQGDREVADVIRVVHEK